MKKIILIFGLVGLFLVTAAVPVWGYLVQGWFVRGNLTDVQALLEPDLEITFPQEKKSVYPTAILFHGCGGKFDHQKYWADYFNRRGFAVIVVDSLTPRKNVEPRQVCRGHQLLASERVVDVYADLKKALDSIWVDKDNLYLAGWSHGAWTVMDAISNLSNEQSSLNMKRLNLILFYPYCGWVSRTRYFPWGDHLKTDALFLLADQDTVADSGQCLDLIHRMDPVQHSTQVRRYPANHAFDYPPAMAGKKGVYPDAAQKAQAELDLSAWLDKKI